MSMRKRVLVLVLGVLLMAGGVFASNFRVADTIYILAAINSRGAGGAIFDSDIVIWNPNSVAVDVDVAFLPTNNVDNRTITNVKSVGPIAANGQLSLDSILRNEFADLRGVGHFIFFSCKSGGDCSDCDANPADCAPIAVEGRNYATSTTADPPTYGQLFTGLPWFSFASRDEASRDLDQVWLLGLRQAGSAGVSGFRTNIGIVNSSQFSKTKLRVTLYSEATSAQYGSPFEYELNPLGHIQLLMSGTTTPCAPSPGSGCSMFPGFEGRGYAKVEQISVTATGDPDFPDGAPGFFAFASVVDNKTSDPTSVEPIYPTSDPYLEVFSTTAKSGAQRPRHAVRRPVVKH